MLVRLVVLEELSTRTYVRTNTRTDNIALYILDSLITSFLLQVEKTQRMI